MNFLIQTHNFYFENFLRIFPGPIEVINAFSLILLIFLLTNFGKFLLKRREPAIINFFLGWIILYYFLFFGNWIFNISLSLLTKIFFLGITIFLIKKKFILFNIKDYDLKILFILSPYFLILLSMNTVEWDSFAFWSYQTDYLINNDSFINDKMGKIFHHASYPQAKNILIASGSIITGVYSENLPSIFSLIILFLISNFFYYTEKRFKYFFIFLTFCTPILITDKIFSHYHDFILGTSILVSIYVISKINFISLLEKEKYSYIFYYGLICSLTPIIKNVGIIHTFSTIFCFSLILIFERNFQKKNYFDLIKKYFFFIFTVIFAWFLWKIYIVSSGVSLNEYLNFGDHGFRIYLLKDFIISALNQIIEREIALIVLLLPVILFFLKNNKKFKIYTYHYFFIASIWLIFLLINYLTNFSEGLAKNASSFYRYLYQVIPLALYILIIYISLNNNHKLKRYLVSINKFLIIIIMIFPIIFITKIRKDLLPLYLDANLISQKIINLPDKNNKKFFLISEYPSLQKEIISYYSKIPKKNIFYNKDINFIIDYEIHIDNLSKIKNRNSYIIQTKKDKKIFIYK